MRPFSGSSANISQLEKSTLTLGTNNILFSMYFTCGFRLYTALQVHIMETIQVFQTRCNRQLPTWPFSFVIFGDRTDSLYRGCCLHCVVNSVHTVIA